MKHIRNISCCIVGIAGGFVIVTAIEILAIALLFNYSQLKQFIASQSKEILWTFQISWWLFGIFQGLVKAARIIIREQLQDLKITLEKLKNTADGNNTQIPSDRKAEHDGA